MRVAIHPHDEQEPYRLPHQGMWFVLLLIALLLLLSKNVGGLVRHRVQQDIDSNRISFD